MAIIFSLHILFRVALAHIPIRLSLGRDNQILITRAKVEDSGGAKFLGTRRVESFVYDIQVKNNRKVPVLIKIQDQVPVSQESDIIVDVEDISGATRDTRLAVFNGSELLTREIISSTVWHFPYVIQKAAMSLYVSKESCEPHDTDNNAM